MIRPDTAPGTEVVCIDASDGALGPTGLERGAVYTVASIQKGVAGKHVVLVEEVRAVESYLPPWGMVKAGFSLTRFKYLDLPPELTRLLDEVPQDVYA
jgi:hypothetical protein